MTNAFIPDSAHRLLGADDFESESIPFDARIQYGSDSIQYADLRLPKGHGPFPVCVVIHGGCWKGLHRARNIEGLANALTNFGWATWNLSHRQTVDTGGGWPGTFRDIAAGIEALSSAATVHPLDLSHVVTVGHSAGGHLALWASARNKIAPESDIYVGNGMSISGVVSLAGIADLQLHFEDKDNSCGDGLTMLMDGAPGAHPDRYAIASPSNMLPLGIPQLLICGALDRIVPVSLVRSYAEKATQTGDDVELLVVPGAGHFELIAPASGLWKEHIAPAVGKFLSKIVASDT